VLRTAPRGPVNFGVDVMDADTVRSMIQATLTEGHLEE
jgi:hypothetical protein